MSSSTFIIPPDPFSAIASNLAKISDTMRMAAAGGGVGVGGVGPLAERSVNIAPQVSTGMKPTAGKKRKSDGAPTIDPDDIELPQDMVIEWSAQQIRAKIRQFINSGEMKIGQFQSKLGVSGTSYNHFMKLNGSDKGSGSDTYFAAAEFFKRRQLAGVKTSRQKKSKPNASSSSTSTSTAAASAARTSTSSSAASSSSNPKSKKDEIAEVEAANDVSSVKLTGEDDDNVPVMDTCDDVRAKINKYLRETPHATGASFIRTVNRALPESSDRQASAQTLSRFLGASGPRKGAESMVFYAAYVFFEKLRLKQDKPKTQKRLDVEKAWGPRGVDLEDSSRTRVWVGPGIPDIYEDKFGKLQTVRVRR